MIRGKSRRIRASLAIALGLAVSASAQQGDKPGEVQRDLPEDLQVPPAPVLPPVEALRSISVEPGFRVELVASEPLVEDPVAALFGPDGRLWVVEMRGFMPDVDGTDELRMNGRVVVLDDKDGDGRMDESRVFLDHLILPRAIALAHGGLLLIEPPDLDFYKDEDGDGRPDLMLHLLSGFAGLDSPEHAGNGLVYGIDNAFHLSQHPLRFFFDGERVVTEATPGHGQWGLARDDIGRFYYSTNGDPLRVDLVPLHYARRNPSLPRLIGVNERILHDFSVWPARMTPGVNRGYQPGILDESYRLRAVTATCGPAVYRGHTFGDEFVGDVFICEPAGNLVKRVRIQETEDGGLLAVHATPGREFLTSTDERFRPVNAFTGPDGALYIVDFYRGILQHKVFMTTFLRKQVIARGLDKPVGLGRIYRVVREGAPAQPRPALDRASDLELVAALGHENGFYRDTAQRLLVERKPSGVAQALREMARGDDAIPAIHALWTLDGIGALDSEDAREALGRPDWRLRVHALRLLERFIEREDAVALVEERTCDEDPRVRQQAALSLGAGRGPHARLALRRLITRAAAERPIRSAVLSGLRHDETAFLRALLSDPSWSAPGGGRSDFLKGLVDCALRASDPALAADLIELAAQERIEGWQRDLIGGQLARHLRLGNPNPGRLRLSRPPDGWEAFVAREGEERWMAIDARLRWPGRAVDEPSYVWSEDERRLLDLGGQLYASACSSCHQPDGRGQPGVAPPLRNSERVSGDPDRLIRILLHGLSGPLVVDGEAYNADMPKSAAPTDRQIAAILTYVRNSFDNEAPPVAPRDVQRVRDATRGRSLPWSAAELDSLP